MRGRAKLGSKRGAKKRANEGVSGRRRNPPGYRRRPSSRKHTARDPLGRPRNCSKPRKGAVDQGISGAGGQVFRPVRVTRVPGGRRTPGTPLGGVVASGGGGGAWPSASPKRWRRPGRP